MDWPYFCRILRRCSSLRTITFKASISLGPFSIRTIVKDTLFREIVEKELVEWDERGMLQVCIHSVLDGIN